MVERGLSMAGRRAVGHMFKVRMDCLRSSIEIVCGEAHGESSKERRKDEFHCSNRSSGGGLLTKGPVWWPGKFRHCIPTVLYLNWMNILITILSQLNAMQTAHGRNFCYLYNVATKSKNKKNHIGIQYSEYKYKYTCIYIFVWDMM